MELGDFILGALLVLAVVLPLARVGRCEAALKSGGDLGELYNQLVSFHQELLDQFSELETTQEALRKSEERYKLAMEGANDGLWDYDIIKDELYLSERSGEILNIPAGIFGSLSEYLDLVLYPEDREHFEAMLKQHFAGETPHFICEHRVKSAPGTWLLVRCKLLRDKAGTPVRLAGSHSDNTEMKKTQATIEQLAFNDPLTGLANRTSLSERAAIMAEQCTAGSSMGAFFFIDLDNFKLINDTFGHFCGDRILTLVGERLTAIGGPNTFVARLGGDEFAILLENIQSREEVEAYAENLLRQFQQPINIDDKELHVTLSAGITLCPEDAATTEELFKYADLAMYSAKSKGKNLYAFFSKGMDEQVRKKMLMEHHLREALGNNEFQLCYQPVISLADGRINGFEALIRWHSKDFGLVMPMDFIRLAEETGLIVPIGRWVLQTVCQFMAELIRNGHRDLRISVNLSVVELYRSDFAAAVKQIIAAADIPPGSIALEITESMLMESTDTSLLNLELIRQHGMSICLDDFGTGYSSLKYLMDLPIDIVKIDKSFIDYMNHEGVEKELTGSIIELARKIGLKTVAEGVETKDQLEKLQQYQCDMCQGYLFSKPVPAAQIYDLLRKYT